MPEPDDAVMPILRRIQKELAELNRGTKEGFLEVRAGVRQLSERLDSFEGYFTYEMGLTARNQADIKRLQGQMAVLEGRVEELEPQP